MATKFKFGTRTVGLPGAYSRIVSGRKNPPLDLDYGRLLIFAEAGQIRGGSGISGTNASGRDCIYEVNDTQEMQEFVGEGFWWKAAEALFKPNGFDNGVSKVYIVKPFATTAAELTLDLETGDTGGKIVFQTIDEGTLVNGVKENINSVSYLTAGYSYTVTAGEEDAAKWMLKFWLSTYRGAPTDGIPYDEISKETAVPRLLLKSVEFDNMNTLVDWAATSKELSNFFTVKSTNIKSTGAVIALEIGAVTGWQLAAGGTETEASANFNSALDAVADLNYNVIMYKSGEGLEVDTDTLKIKTHILDVAKYDKFLVLGGSDDDKTESKSSAIVLNSDRVILVHGAIKKRSQLANSGYRTWSSGMNACYVVGRMLGLEPQVPITFKAINIDGVVSKLNEKERQDMLDHGVITVNFDEDRSLFIIEQDVNTLQNNTYTLNADGTSHVIQLRRIAAQLNKELVYNAKLDLLSNPNGVNRNTLSPKVLQDWTKGYLARKIAKPDADNLILSFQEVTVTRQEDAYYVTYKFEPNSEIRIIFFTGFML